jgi:hypothetical protein
MTQTLYTNNAVAANAGQTGVLYVAAAGVVPAHFSVDAKDDVGAAVIFGKKESEGTNATKVMINATSGDIIAQ